jgi:transcriptional regulator with XRE-family HTH domain
MISIKEKRLLKRKTQAETAAALNMSISTYKHYETEERRTPIPVLVRLAAYYGVTVDDLIDKEAILAGAQQPAADVS